jgi:hypothetical protein
MAFSVGNPFEFNILPDVLVKPEQRKKLEMALAAIFGVGALCVFFLSPNIPLSSLGKHVMFGVGVGMTGLMSILAIRDEVLAKRKK